MNKKVLIAYCGTSALPEVTKKDIKMLTGIHIAFGLINEAGEAYWETKGTQEPDTKGSIGYFKKINPEIKIVLSIGGWGADGFSQAASTEEGRKRFAESAVKIMEEYQMDGLDIDWEYPCSSQAEIASSPEDKENFTLLMAELRRQIDLSGEGKILSIAAGALPSFIAGTNMGEVQKYLDYVQLMTYDFHGVFTETTGHHANLYDDAVTEEKICSDGAIRMFVEAGVPVEKIVMGAAFYGRHWDNVPKENHGLGQVPANRDVTGFHYDKIQEMLQTGEGNYRYHWDDDAKAPWLYNGNSFITYEDERALSHKAAYVKEHNLMGMMFWEYSHDKTQTLVEHLHKELQK